MNTSQNIYVSVFNYLDSLGLSLGCVEAGGVELLLLLLQHVLELCAAAAPKGVDRLRRPLPLLLHHGGAGRRHHRRHPARLGRELLLLLLHPGRQRLVVVRRLRRRRVRGHLVVASQHRLGADAGVVELRAENVE